MAIDKPNDSLTLIDYRHAVDAQSRIGKHSRTNLPHLELLANDRELLRGLHETETAIVALRSGQTNAESGLQWFLDDHLVDNVRLSGWDLTVSLSAAGRISIASGTGIIAGRYATTTAAIEIELEPEDKEEAGHLLVRADGNPTTSTPSFSFQRISDAEFEEGVSTWKTWYAFIGYVKWNGDEVEEVVTFTANALWTDQTWKPITGISRHALGVNPLVDPRCPLPIVAMREYQTTVNPMQAHLVGFVEPGNFSYTGTDVMKCTILDAFFGRGPEKQWWSFVTGTGAIESATYAEWTFNACRIF